MSAEEDSFVEEDFEEESFEEEEDLCDGDCYYCFGTEPNRTYLGKKMDQLDQCFRDDEKIGHLILRPNMVLHHRYQIKKMIGRGTFCLVWLAYDYLLCENVAIKILKRNDNPVEEESFEDELIICQYLTKVEEKVPQNMTSFYDVFYHNDHCCIVFELVSQNILTFINYFDEPSVPIPIPLIKKIVVDTLKALDFMHKHQTIHTDLKPENVFAERPIFPYEPFSEDDDREVFNCLEDDPSTINFKLGDFGNSCFIDNALNDLIQTRQYRSPEVILGMDYDYSADIWSLACMTFELATKVHLFDPQIGDPRDNIEEGDMNKSEFDATHISMIESVIGPIPKDWARNGKNYNFIYDDHDKLICKYYKQLPSVYDLLIKYRVKEDDARELADFLQPMLAIIPSQRLSAEELLDSPWLYQV